MLLFGEKIMHLYHQTLDSVLLLKKSIQIEREIWMHYLVKRQSPLS